MRNLIIIAMLAGVAFTAGWFTINRDGEHTTIQFNRAEIREDTRRVIDKGREILDNRDQQFANDQQQQQQQQQQDPRYADRNSGFQQQDQQYRQPNYQQNGYQDPNQAPWNQNYGRPDPRDFQERR